jgi:hypothetical protein
MSARALEDGTRHAYQQFYRARPRLKRFWRDSRRRDPRFGTALTMAGQNTPPTTATRHPPRSPATEARPDDLARLALASAAPAQESLAVAYASAGGTVGPGTVVRVGPRPS